MPQNDKPQDDAAGGELDYEKVLADLQMIESMLASTGGDDDQQGPPEITLNFPLAKVLELLPEEFIANPDAEYEENRNVAIVIENLYEQLARGKVVVSVAKLAYDVPAEIISSEALVEEETQVSLPLPMVVAALDPEALAKRTAPKQSRYDISDLPDPFRDMKTPDQVADEKGEVLEKVAAEEEPEAVAEVEAEPVAAEEPEPAIAVAPPKAAPAEEEPVAEPVEEPAIAVAPPAPLEPEPVVEEPAVAAPVPPPPLPEPVEEPAAAIALPAEPEPEPVLEEPAVAAPVPPPPLPEPVEEPAVAIALPAEPEPEPVLEEPVLMPELEPVAIEEPEPVIIEPAPAIAAAEVVMIEEVPPVVEAVPAPATVEEVAVAEPELEPATVEEVAVAEPELEPVTVEEAPVAETEPEAMPAAAAVPAGKEEWEDLERLGGVNLNTAVMSQLMTLDGVTDAVAKSIIDHREKHGPFKSVFDVHAVPRVGRKTFKKITGMAYNRAHHHRLLKLAKTLNLARGSIGKLPDIVEAVASKPGIAGCVVSDEQGLPVARSKDDKLAAKLGAIAPRLMLQVRENAEVLKMDEVDSISMCAGRHMYTVCAVGDVYMTVVHRDRKLTKGQLDLIRKVTVELAWLLGHRGYVGH